MPLSSLKDPVALGLAEGALEMAWQRLQREGLLISPESDRIKLAAAQNAVARLTSG